jgi:hypothetical protein
MEDVLGTSCGPYLVQVVGGALHGLVHDPLHIVHHVCHVEQLLQVAHLQQSSTGQQTRILTDSKLCGSNCGARRAGWG